MTGVIRKHLDITPFVPFAVRTSDGREYPVPTIDHIYLPPAGGRVVIRDVVALCEFLGDVRLPGSGARAYHF